MNTSASSEPSDPHRWSRRAQDIAAVGWSSFLAACLATLLFFAVFDPVMLGDDLHPPKWLRDRMTGYALGFFFFWFVSTVAAVLTAYLLETEPEDRDEP
jgi:hypothetical protein